MSTHSVNTELVVKIAPFSRKEEICYFSLSAYHNGSHNPPSYNHIGWFPYYYLYSHIGFLA